MLHAFFGISALHGSQNTYATAHGWKAVVFVLLAILLFYHLLM